VVCWAFFGEGKSRVTSLGVGSVEGSRGRGRELPGRVPVQTGMVGGASIVVWKTLGWNCRAVPQRWGV